MVLVDAPVVLGVPLKGSVELTKTYDIALELAELRRGPIQQMPHRETNRSQAGAHRCPRFPRWICSVNRCRKRRTELENMCGSFFKCETAPQATDEEENHADPGAADGN